MSVPVKAIQEKKDKKLRGELEAIKVSTRTFRRHNVAFSACRLLTMSN